LTPLAFSISKNRLIGGVHFPGLLIVQPRRRSHSEFGIQRMFQIRLFVGHIRFQPGQSAANRNTGFVNGFTTA